MGGYSPYLYRLESAMSDGYLSGVLAQNLILSQNFHVDLQLNGSLGVDATFSECQSFICTSDVIEICEVTPYLWGRENQSKGRVVRTKLPGNANYSSLILRRGSSRSINFWEWFESTQNSWWSKERKDMSLSFGGEGPGYEARLDLYGAWPNHYKLGDVNAGSTELQIEEIEIVFDYFQRVQP